MSRPEECPVPDNITDEAERARFILHAALHWAWTGRPVGNGALERAAQEVYRKLRETREAGRL